MGLEVATRLLLQAQKSASGEPVIYRRDGRDIGLQAVRGSALVDRLGPDGEAISARRDEWIVSPGDLVLDGLEFLPEVGDRIVARDGKSDEEHFGVTRGDGGRCYDWTDQTKMIMRVHCVVTRGNA